ncbi:MAG TPA: ComF family protein [Pyrinomonadaceae bacterium]
MLQKVFDSLFALTYPQVCHVCRSSSVENLADGIACRDCWAKTRIFCGREILCEKCGAYLRDADAPIETYCHRCDEQFYDRARAVGIYENALAASILQLKREPFISRNLQKLFISAFPQAGFQNANLIIPVPLSKKRRLERGFNQAEILAAILAKETKINLDEKSIVRVVHTPMHRVAMDKKARETTVENAFEVKRQNFIKDATILLIDDVFTSGATVSNCAQVLKQSGAQKVYVLTVARTIS